VVAVAGVRTVLVALAVGAGACGKGGAMMEKRTHATGRTDVETYVPTKFDEVAGGPALVEVQLKEKFSGDVEGEGIARVVQAVRGDGSATFAGMERVRGAIGGRQGTFLLDVSGTVAGKKMDARWSVIPGSGTGALAGLHGDGGFEAQLGQHGSIWLDYFFSDAAPGPGGT
jgi:hypothetical protein